MKADRRRQNDTIDAEQAAHSGDNAPSPHERMTGWWNRCGGLPADRIKARRVALQMIHAIISPEERAGSHLAAWRPDTTGCTATPSPRPRSADRPTGGTRRKPSCTLWSTKQRPVSAATNQTQLLITGRQPRGSGDPSRLRGASSGKTTRPQSWRGTVCAAYAVSRWRIDPSTKASKRDLKGHSTPRPSNVHTDGGGQGRRR